MIGAIGKRLVTPPAGQRDDSRAKVRSVQETMSGTTLMIDCGDLACGELLMLVYRRVRSEPAGTTVGIITTDPAAPIDIPAWCHLTGHQYVGPAAEFPAGTYLVELTASARAVDPDRPWHPQPSSEEN